MAETGTSEGPHTHQRYRLIVADDHAGMRQEIRDLLDPEFDVLRLVSGGAELLRATEELRPDVVVSDVQMPEMDGIEAGCHMLSKRLCDAIVVLSVHPDRHLVQTAMNAGIRAYVLKLDASDELIPAVYAALRGERYLSSGVRGRSNTGSRNQ